MKKEIEKLWDKYQPALLKWLARFICLVILIFLMGATASGTFHMIRNTRWHGQAAGKKDWTLPKSLDGAIFPNRRSQYILEFYMVFALYAVMAISFIIVGTIPKVPYLPKGVLPLCGIVLLLSAFCALSTLCAIKSRGYPYHYYRLQWMVYALFK